VVGSPIDPFPSREDLCDLLLDLFIGEDTPRINELDDTLDNLLCKGLEKDTNRLRVKWGGTSFASRSKSFRLWIDTRRKVREIQRDLDFTDTLGGGWSALFDHVRLRNNGGYKEQYKAMKKFNDLNRWARSLKDDILLIESGTFDEDVTDVLNELSGLSVLDNVIQSFGGFKEGVEEYNRRLLAWFMKE